MGLEMNVNLHKVRTDCSRSTSGSMGGARGAIAPPPLDGCWPKNWDVRTIKSRFYQSQTAPKVAFLSSKIGKISPLSSKIKEIICGGDSPLPTDPPQTPLQWGGGHLPTPTPSAPRYSRLCRSTSAPPFAPPPSHTWIRPWVQAGSQTLPRQFTIQLWMCAYWYKPGDKYKPVVWYNCTIEVKDLYKLYSMISGTWFQPPYTWCTTSNVA